MPFKYFDFGDVLEVRMGEKMACNWVWIPLCFMFINWKAIASFQCNKISWTECLGASCTLSLYFRSYYTRAFIRFTPVAMTRKMPAPLFDYPTSSCCTDVQKKVEIRRTPAKKKKEVFPAQI
jgi:hypothetical protein